VAERPRGGPIRDEVLAYIDGLSNWGRWGDDDRRGTLNLITPAKVLEASALIQRGVVVPLGRTLDPAAGDPLGRGTEISIEPTTYEIGRVNAFRERASLMSHGSPTHIDAPNHMAWDRRWYNGVSLDEGLDRSPGVEGSAAGIVTRGVLLDIAGIRGVEWLEEGDGIYPDDIEDACRAQGVEVRPGDLLLARTGYMKRITEHPETVGPGSIGYHASCLPWLRSHDVAVIGSDALNDMNPSGFGSDQPVTPDEYATRPSEELDLAFPIHVVTLSAMGAWLLDNVWLEGLKSACEKADRWEFFVAFDPLLLVGASGSPVNPLAIF
jgi:kynurenine formamidase